MRALVLTVPLSFGLYVLLAGETSATELGTGAGVAFVILCLAWWLRRAGERRMRLQAGAAVRAAAGAVASLPGDVARVGGALCVALVRRASGAAGFTRHEPGAPVELTAEAAGARGAAVLGRSLAPNGIVLGVEDGAYLTHKLARG